MELCGIHRNPHVHAHDYGGGGIRKLRYATQGRGKSGGVRVIYYWLKDEFQIYMLVAYPKSAKDTLTDKEVALLYELVKEL
jgi:hypothetical protein